MDEASKATLFNALAWVDALKTREGVDAQEVDAALTRLTEAFGVDVRDAEQKRQLAVNGEASFDEIFAAGLKALNLETGTRGVAQEAAVDEDPVVQKHPELWKKWVAKLEAKGFFKGAAPGSSEHAVRTTKALAKFKEKFGDVKPELSKEEKEAKAEEVKAQGNAALSRQDYEGAAKLYREALQLSADGPSSHIYHSNLAAALTYLGKYTEVIDHCEQSIALKPSYVKAYSRMGSAQVQLKDFDGAIDTFRRGLEVDSTNAACRDGLADAERKRRQVQSTPAASASAPAGGAGGMPDLSNLASMLGGGGGGGLADLMNNPQMMQMAQSMMQNPQMMQMAQNMMQNPDMLNNLMGNLGGGGGGAAPGAGAGGMPDMSGLMNSPELVAARSDPDLQDFFRDVDSEGPSAAMRHMSNPKVSQLMQSVMSRMQG
ncbi:Hsc70 cochaperone [Phytophthora cinnamomi]|uniref:Hsc70 cochaperone n=1 Tax=Phytophthora cinnamomi TaxID=4785 RepID=UPI00355A272A|nr:Hsc70 cochaperone [Phytophthora cinnamomi]